MKGSTVASQETVVLLLLSQPYYIQYIFKTCENLYLLHDKQLLTHVVHHLCGKDTASVSGQAETCTVT